MEKTIFYKISVIFLCTILLIVGIYIGLQIFNFNIKKEAAKDVINKDEEIKTVNNEEVNPYVESTIAKEHDIELIYEDYYTLCKDSIINKTTVYSTTMDELKQKEIEKQEKLGTKYEIIEESNDRLVFKRNIDKYCGAHYRVQLDEKNNEVIIYSLEDKELYSVYNTVNVYTNTLKDELVDELKQGIEVNSNQELEFLIEDLES